jgi:hypothetical protein
VQQFWRLVVDARGPVSKSKAAATAPDAADAADTRGGGGEGAGVDLGFVLQASADNEEVAPSATRDGGPGAWANAKDVTSHMTSQCDIIL